jgi:hypothetical protein
MARRPQEHRGIGNLSGTNLSLNNVCEKGDHGPGASYDRLDLRAPDFNDQARELREVHASRPGGGCLR